MRMLICLFAMLFGLAASPAMAYIGPGAGAGTIAVVLGIVGSVGLALFAIVWYPVKRMLSKRKSRQANAEAETSSH